MLSEFHFSWFVIVITYFKKTNETKKKNASNMEIRKKCFAPFIFPVMETLLWFNFEENHILLEAFCRSIKIVSLKTCSYY